MKKIIYTVLLIDLLTILFFLCSCSTTEFVSSNYDIHTYSGLNYNIPLKVTLVKQGSKVYKTTKFGTRVYRKKNFEFYNDSIIQRDNVAKIIYYE